MSASAAAAACALLSPPFRPGLIIKRYFVILPGRALSSSAFPPPPARGAAVSQPACLPACPPPCLGTSACCLRGTFANNTTTTCDTFHNTFQRAEAWGKLLRSYRCSLSPRAAAAAPLPPSSSDSQAIPSYTPRRRKWTFTNQQSENVQSLAPLLGQTHLPRTRTPRGSARERQTGVHEADPSIPRGTWKISPTTTITTTSLHPLHPRHQAPANLQRPRPRQTCPPTNPPSLRQAESPSTSGPTDHNSPPYRPPPPPLPLHWHKARWTQARGEASSRRVMLCRQFLRWRPLPRPPRNLEALA